MLREEVWEQWKAIQTKLVPIRLSPVDKEVYHFMKNSQTAKFTLYSLDEKPDWWETRLKTEEEQFCELIEKEVKSELITDYWFTWSALSDIALKWIESRKILLELNSLVKDLVDKFPRNRKEENMGDGLARFYYALDEETIEEQEILHAQIKGLLTRKFFPPSDDFGPTIEEVD